MTQTYLSTTLDTLFFAPAKILDQDGRIPYASGLSNFFAAPFVRSSALTGAFLAATAAALDLKSASITALSATCAAGISQILKNRHTPSLKYYFDTTPEKQRDIPTRPIAEDLVSTGYTHFDFRAPLLATSGGSIFLYSLGASLQTVAIYTSVMGIGFLSDAFAKKWRVRQVLEGNWNIETSLPGDYYDLEIDDDYDGDDGGLPARHRHAAPAFIRT